MGIPYITPDRLTKAYDSIGEAGCRRCGELRTDGTGVYALFKCGQTVNPTSDSNWKARLISYSFPDIVVIIESGGTTPVGIYQTYDTAVNVNQYLWVCLRGVSPRQTTHFEASPAETISIGEAIISNGAVVETNNPLKVPFALALYDVPNSTVRYHPVYLVRPCTK